MKQKLFILGLLTLCVTPLASCNSSNDDTPSRLDTILYSLKEANHDASIYETVTVLHPYEANNVDITNEITLDYTFRYEGEKRSHSRKQFISSYDINKETGEPIDVTKRVTSIPYTSYYKNVETGIAEVRRINYQNELEVSTVVSQSEDGSYVPIIYDNVFINPFDFITTRDLTILENGDISLSKSKANFLVESYNTIGVNMVDTAIIHVNENDQIESIDFTIPDLVGANYIRKNTLRIEYSNHDSVYEELKPFENNNPELAEALLKYEDVTNFTYTKDYVSSTNQVLSRITGFFTEETIFFHHGEATDTEPYKKGDDYDYKAELEDDGLYYIYQYNFVSIDYYQWSKVVLTGTAYYTFSNFRDMGPRYFDISPSVFKKTGEKTYEIESLLLPSAGQYFDYGVWGVHTSLLDSTTTKLVITLNDDNEIELIQTAFLFENKINHINFHYSNINSTTIPSWYNDN